MPEYRPYMLEKTYQFDKIEKDIITDYLYKENMKSMMERGVNKYNWYWVEESNDEIGSYSSLFISEFMVDSTTKMAKEVPMLKIIPVDKYNRIVQTSDQRKKYADRIARTLAMEQKMAAQSINLKAETAANAKMPNFAPQSDISEA